MSYYLGQRARIRTEVRDVAGVLTNTTLALTLTRPDGTTVVPGVTNDSTGVYHADVLLDQAGDWLRVWSGTGAVEVADADQFRVVATTLRIIGLAEAKEHRNITATADDRELLDFIGAAQKMIEGKVGPVVPFPVVDEVHYPATDLLVLKNSPVVEVTAVQEYSGGTGLGVLPAGQYRLDQQAGMLRRLTASGSAGWWQGSEVRVSYTPGRRPIPDNLRLAAKELVGHLWKRSQALRGGGRAGQATPEETVAGMGYAMPNAVLEMIADDLRLPGLA